MEVPRAPDCITSAATSYLQCKALLISAHITLYCTVCEHPALALSIGLDWTRLLLLPPQSIGLTAFTLSSRVVSHTENVKFRLIISLKSITKRTT